MAKTATITVKINEKLKQNAERVLKTLGINTSQVITMLYKQIELQQGIPFPVKIPNEETIEALEDVIAEKNMDTFETLDELYKDLDI